jgi:hypothetical protein
MLFYSLRGLLKPSEESLKGIKWFLVEFGIRCFGGILVITVAIDYCGFFLIGSFIISGIIQFVTKMKERGKTEKDEDGKEKKTGRTSQFPFISEYRSAIMNSTGEEEVNSPPSHAHSHPLLMLCVCACTCSLTSDCYSCC